MLFAWEISGSFGFDPPVYTGTFISGCLSYSPRRPATTGFHGWELPSARRLLESHQPPTGIGDKNGRPDFSGLPHPYKCAYRDRFTGISTARLYFLVVVFLPELLELEPDALAFLLA